VRWLNANVRIVGQDPDGLNITEGIDMVVASLRSGSPSCCTITDFYAPLFPEKENQASPLEAGLRQDFGRRRFLGNNIQSAEQVEMLAKMGLARDLRKRK